VFSAQRSDWLYGAVLAAEAFLLRYAVGTGRDRLVVVNLGGDLDLSAIPEPLLVPPRRARWRLIFSTEDARYGGSGTPPFEPCGLLTVPAHCTLVLSPEDER
jgi:maltooligosyltrehalose trehalohydrolase